MPIEFTIKAHFSITAEKIYKAWLDGKEHSKMTGEKAFSTDVVGADFSAWDGYISGKNIELIPNKTIKQTWRTTDFDENDENSIVLINFTNKQNGCELVLKHSNIPIGQPDYKQGWQEFYFTPMGKYFNKNE